MKQLFGRLPDGREVWQYTLRDGALSLDVLDYGATLRALRVPDRNGSVRDILLGFDRLEDYLQATWYLGATIGRFGNRIGGAAFELDGKQYRLAANDGKNHLHGGNVGFDRQLWTVKAADASSITLTLVSPDGQEGYPGTLAVTVRFTLRDSALTIDYTAESDKPTLCNLTNHSYFNLNGHDSGNVLAQSIQIRADRYTPTDAASIPTGELAPVAETPLDLRRPVPIGLHIDDSFDQLRMAGGYDHNFVLLKQNSLPAAEAYSAESGIRLAMYTTLPGVQFYSGNYVKDGPAGKGGVRYAPRSGFCLETQVFPDAPHHEGFPSAVLRPGAAQQSQTVYRFSAE